MRQQYEPKKEKTRLIKQLAIELQFDKVGIAPIQPIPKISFFEHWLARSLHGSMAWMEKHKEVRKDIRNFFSDAQSVIVVAQNYYTPHQIKENSSTAKISRYAWGQDYHKIIKKKLRRLLKLLKNLDPNLEGKPFVDSAPVMEKQWAVLAGIGWQGKNTNILTREMGSWIFLGGLVINQKLIYDQPVQDYCGNCNACIEACPTGALEPYVLNATRCLSYLTIEYQGNTIPPSLSSKMENWVFGCDVCQDVCPWNRFAKETKESRFHPKNSFLLNPPLSVLAQLTKEKFDEVFAGTPVRRAKYLYFMRNVQTILENQ